MKKIFFLLVILTSLSFPSRIWAQESNKFGIHILETDEAGQVAELVNSQGGDWGYVTIALRINDLDQEKWQKFFDECRRQHLIPLVRLATEGENEYWKKPTKNNIDELVNFLTSLNWPVKNRYVIVFNETNHKREWGSDVNPAEYAKTLAYAISSFKEKDDNFQILNGGFDLAADNSATTMDTYRYWQIMNQTIPGIFNQLDGWSSHSYPNPGFIGKPTDQGRKSILGYRWEMAILRSDFGLKKELPIFITETGWPQNNPKLKINNLNFYDSETIAEYIEVAFSLWLKDNKVKAITPFVLNYHAPPLDVFSWLDRDGKHYPHYETVKNMTKNSWQPEQINSWEIQSLDLPQFLPINSHYQGKIILKNTGQSIWGEGEFIFKSLSISADDIILPPGILVEPGKSHQFVFDLWASEWPETISISWQKLEEETTINFFNPSQLSSYQDNFWQKIIALVKVWWYKKTTIVQKQQIGHNDEQQ